MFCVSSVNLPVYTLMLKQKVLQLQNLVYRDTEKSFWEDLGTTFLKNLSRFFRIIFKNIFLDFSANYFFYFTILCIFMWYSRSTVLKFSIELLNKDFEMTLKRFFKNRFRLFTETHQNGEYLFGLQVTRKNINCHENFDMFLQ